MTNSPDIVWNAITDSAKKKFDYKEFEEQLNEINENLADNILFAIIAGFASNKTKEIISLELYNEMLLTGFMWKLENIEDFIKDKDKIFKLEIFSSKLAGSLLEDGTDPLIVLNTINRVLTFSKSKT